MNFKNRIPILSLLWLVSSPYLPSNMAAWRAETNRLVRCVPQRNQTWRADKSTYFDVFNVPQNEWFIIFIMENPSKNGWFRGTPYGKRLHNYGHSSFLMGKSTISMAIFRGYFPLPPLSKPFQVFPVRCHWHLAGFCRLHHPPGELNGGTLASHGQVWHVQSPRN